VGVFAYLRAEALKWAKAEDAQYLRKLVAIVNNAKDARWKVTETFCSPNNPLKSGPIQSLWHPSPGLQPQKSEESDGHQGVRGPFGALFRFGSDESAFEVSQLDSI
jgi:hypothetical protein